MTEPETRGSRLYLTGALGLTQILAFGTTVYLPALLAGPIAADTGWPLPAVVAGLSLALLTAGFVSPAVGREVARRGGRAVLAGSSLLMALGLVVQGLAPSLPFHLAGWIVTGVGMGCGLYDAAFATLGRLYGSNARAAITNVTLLGGFASTVFWPIGAVMVDTLGWRATCFAYAALHVFVGFSLHILAVPKADISNSGENTPGAGSLRGLSRYERMNFRLLIGLAIAGGVISSTISVHVIHLLRAQGLSFASAVAAAALIGPSQVAARFVEMIAGRRHHPIYTLLAATVLVAAGLLLLLLGLPVPALALIIYGAGNGIWSIVRGTLPLALFKPENYPVIMGRLAMPSLLAQAAAPPVIAVLMTQGGSDLALAAILAGAIVNIALSTILYARIRHLGPR